ARFSADSSATRLENSFMRVPPSSLLTRTVLRHQKSVRALRGDGPQSYPHAERSVSYHFGFHLMDSHPALLHGQSRQLLDTRKVCGEEAPLSRHHAFVRPPVWLTTNAHPARRNCHGCLCVQGQERGSRSELTSP